LTAQRVRFEVNGNPPYSFPGHPPAV